MAEAVRFELTRFSHFMLEAPIYLGAMLCISVNLFPECSQLKEDLGAKNGQAAGSARFMLTHQKEVIKVISFHKLHKAHTKQYVK